MRKIILLVFITFISLIGINSIKAQTNLKVSILDDTGKYVEFTNTNEAKLGMKNGKANPYKVKIEAEFDDAPSNKQIEVNLKEGINLVDNGSKTLTNFLKGSVTHTGQSKNILGTTYNANNGKITYNFTDLTENVVFEMIISPDVMLDIEQIQSAIVVKQIQNSEVKNTKSINTNVSLNEVPIVVNGNNQAFNVALDEEVVKTNTMRLAGLYIYENNISYNKLFKKVNVYVEAPFDVEHVSYLEVGSSVATHSILGWKLEEKKPITNKDGKTVNQYKFTQNNFYHIYIGINPSWRFPSNKFKNGDKIDIVATKIEYQTYGKDLVSKDISYKQTYTISNTENVIAYSNKNQIFAAKPGRLDDIIPLGYINFKNTGGVKSKEKELVYNFDDDGYGITDVVFPAFPANKDLKTIDIWYQTKTCNTPTNCVYDTTWKTKNITLNYTGSYDSSDEKAFVKLNIYPYELNKNDLKLGNNTYITKLKINIGIINPNFELYIPHHTFKFFGKRLVSKSEYKTTYEVNDVGYNNTKIGATTGVKEFIATIDGKYYFSPGINSAFNKNQIVSSGNNISFIYGPSFSNHTSISISGYTPNPVYYIRSETGLPITNLKLIGNDDKTNIIDECIITPINAKDGSLVYKIDTKNVKNNLGAIGIYVTLKKSYKLTFDIQTPIDFSDNGKLHDFSTALFITDPNAEFSYLSGDNNGTLNGDPFDVNKNGKTDDVMHYDKQRNIFYQIKNSTDLNVYSYIKKENEKDEQYKYSLDDKDSIIIKKGEKINLKTSLYNSSGVTVKESEVYIPIPKINDNWGELMYNNKAFEYDLELSDKISNPDSSKNKIYYCIVKSTKNLNDLKNMDCKEEISQNELSKVNMIKIKSMNIEDKEKQDIVFNLKSTKDVSSKTNIYRPIYFRNLTNKDGEVKTGWVYSKYLAIQTQKINPSKIINPKTGNILYMIPLIISLLGASIMYFISKKKIKSI